MSSEPTYPGVFIEEIPGGVRTISGVSTCGGSVAGFILRHPIKEAVRVFAFADYERSFSDIAAGTQLGAAVEHYFLHGGSNAWVVRTAPPSGERCSVAVLLHAELA
jgi:phage tail sheath protein FI